MWKWNKVVKSNFASDLTQFILQRGYGLSATELSKRFQNVRSSN